MSKNKSLILFFIPPEKIVNGGVMSIFSLVNETKKLRDIHNSDVELCVYPGNRSYKKNDLFDNNEYVNDFEEIMEKYPQLDTLLIHMPELVVNKITAALTPYEQYLKDIPYIQVNVLNQNIRHMQRPETIAELYRFANHVTQTTAHDRYASQETANKYSLPLKHFSVFIDPGQYKITPYKDKQNIIAYSRDKHEEKAGIITLLSKSLPDYTLIEITDMTYDEYKDTIGKAKYVLTFGEGLDGYLIESTFSGGIGVSVYNSDFFPNDSFKDETFIYEDYKDMSEHLIADIRKFDQADIYQPVVDSMYAKLSKLYSHDNYVHNLTSFYQGNIDFTPTHTSMEHLLIEQATVLYPKINKQHGQIVSMREGIERLQSQLAEAQEKNSDYRNQVAAYESSTSWRITKPLRKLMTLIKK